MVENAQLPVFSSKEMGIPLCINKLSLLGSCGWGNQVDRKKGEEILSYEQAARRIYAFMWRRSGSYGAHGNNGAGSAGNSRYDAADRRFREYAALCTRPAKNRPLWPSKCNKHGHIYCLAGLVFPIEQLESFQYSVS